MDTASLEPYRDVLHHQMTSGIIRDFSTNATAPADTFLRGLNLHRALQILDLGCGFGYMTAELARMVSPDACIIGMDACAENEIPFTNAVAQAQRRSRFICEQIEKRLPFGDNTFDVVFCSYALYFFVDIIPDIARVLKETGCFIAVCHSIDFIDDMLNVAGLPMARQQMMKVFGAFNCENGTQMLAPHFGRIGHVPYRNQLRFKQENCDALATYVIHKLPFIYPDKFGDETIVQMVVHTVAATVARQGEITIAKNDCCFRCTAPHSASRPKRNPQNHMKQLS